MSGENSVSNIEVIGFDLDGTLYPQDNKADERIKTRIAEIMFKNSPEMGSVAKAREIFERVYEKTQSGTKVLKELGYDNPVGIMDQALATANVLDLIKPNPNLVQMLSRIGEDYTLFLLTSGPKEQALEKLEKIGINSKVFKHSFYSDQPTGFSKTDGTAYENVLKTMGYSDGKKHLYVGDRVVADISPAKKYGIRTVLVSDKPNSNADHVIKKPEDLERLLS